MNTPRTFDEIVTEAEKQLFTGWNFSYLEGRYHQDRVSWDLRQILLDHIRKVESMLDMGTGGGEFLSTFAPLPKKTFATEAYAPNVPVAKEKLGPLGAKVFRIQSDELLPFENEQFELIMNRHESFSAKEVYRILKSPGTFITQQVGNRNNLELNELLQKKTLGRIEYEYQKWNQESASRFLKGAGFELIESKDEFPETRFYDVGAVVYYLKAIPWQIPDFSVDRYRKQLKDIHETIQRDGSLKTTAHRFYVIAVKK